MDRTELKKCDEILFEQNKIIDDYLLSIINSGNNNRPTISTLLLSGLRHFVEHVMIKIYCEDNGVDSGDSWAEIETAVHYIYCHNQYSFIRHFHKDYLQKTISHRLINFEYSEILMIKYFSELVKIKDYLKKNYSFDVLNNLTRYPLDLDETFISYYRKIWSVLKNTQPEENVETELFYVSKKKTIYFDGHLMYELVLSPANDYYSRFDNFVVFTTIDVMENYAIRAAIKDCDIFVFDIKTNLKILTSYFITIRQCEFQNYFRVLGINKTATANVEYDYIMRYMKENQISLDKIVLYPKNEYEAFKKNVLNTSGKVFNIIQALDKTKAIVDKKAKGSNVLLYLLHTMRNKVIKPQLAREPNLKISGLYLFNGVLSFDETPFAANLIGCKHPIKLLTDCFDHQEHEDELLARELILISNDSGKIYSQTKELNFQGDIDESILSYNKKIPSCQPNRTIKKFDNYVYIDECEISTVNILKKLKSLTANGISGYKAKARQWLSLNSSQIRGEEKNSYIENMFDLSRVFLIYGAAGTGKTTLIRFVLNLFGNIKKLCLAPTYPALENLKRKISDPSINSYTIKKFVSNNYLYETNYDILVVDECSVVSNRLMEELLNKAKFKVLILTGDIHQLQSIDFGNWFSTARYVLPLHSSCELKEQFRTDDTVLKTLWNKVRAQNDDIDEFLVNNKMVSKLSSEMFQKSKYDDEIILCLNYDGLYGINSINKYLQAKNPNKPIKWNQYIFKVGDRVLFSGLKRFGDKIYNNLKGVIHKIEKDSEKITFEVLVQTTLTELDFPFNEMKIIGNHNDWTLVRFSVFKNKKGDEDKESKINTIIPFQIAYAISIHKAQGLEYDSVKIIITNEVEERITHNVFYTAITRAKKSLKIYWTPETENAVLSNFDSPFDKKDGSIIKNRFHL